MGEDYDRRLPHNIDREGGDHDDDKSESKSESDDNDNGDDADPTNLTGKYDRKVKNKGKGVHSRYMEDNNI